MDALTPPPWRQRIRGRLRVAVGSGIVERGVIEPLAVVGLACNDILYLVYDVESEKFVLHLSSRSVDTIRQRTKYQVGRRFAHIRRSSAIVQSYRSICNNLTGMPSGGIFRKCRSRRP